MMSVFEVQSERVKFVTFWQESSFFIATCLKGRIRLISLVITD